MALKDNLKRLRERAGYENGKELADAIGIAYPRYMTYERGSWPNEETLTKIATQLHTSIDELLGYQPPSPDDFEKCKAFIESASDVRCYFVSIEPDNSVTIQQNIGKKNTSVSVCAFENKTVFIHFVQKLKQAFLETHDYHFAVSMFLHDSMKDLSLLNMMGYGVNEELASIPLSELATAIKNIHQQKTQQLSKILSNPKNEQAFQKNPEFRNVLIDNLNLLNAMAALTNGEEPPAPIPHVGKEPDTDSQQDQAKEKPPTKKADGKHKKD